MFNEEANIEHALFCAVDGLERHVGDFEIIVVDDASTDSSPEVVRRAAATDPRIRIVSHERNRKLGGSLRTGFAAATKDLVIYMDADVPFDPDEIGRAIRALEVSRADVIAGYRIDRTLEGWQRAVYSAIYNTLIRILFGSACRDVNFSFKLLRREVAAALDLHAEGWVIDAEILVKAKNLGFVIQQLGIDYFPRSRGRPLSTTPAVVLGILAELVRLYGDMRHPRRRGPATADAIPLPGQSS